MPADGSSQDLPVEELVGETSQAKWPIEQGCNWKLWAFGLLPRFFYCGVARQMGVSRRYSRRGLDGI